MLPMSNATASSCNTTYKNTRRPCQTGTRTSHDRKHSEYCASRTRLEVEKEVNAAQIGCCRVMNAMDMLQAA